jgi:4'-phosphopantetheinyl transferase
MEEKFPPAGLPDATALHLWWIDLDEELAGGFTSAGGDDLLSDDEKQRAERFRFERDATRFRRCRAMLRLGLGWYSGQNPRNIAIDTGRFGKPFLRESSGLFFNVAHCDGLGVLAFSTRGEVGVDVEALHRTVEAMDIASAYFTPKEAAHIAAAGAERNNAFLRLWTRKEAVLKAAGCGLQQSLDSLDVTRELVFLDDATLGARPSQWQVLDLAPGPGYAGAVAAAPGDWSVAAWNVSSGLAGSSW